MCLSNILSSLVQSLHYDRNISETIWMKSNDEKKGSVIALGCEPHRLCALIGTRLTENLFTNSPRRPLLFHGLTRDPFQPCGVGLQWKEFLHVGE